MNLVHFSFHFLSVVIISSPGVIEGGKEKVIEYVTLNSDKNGEYFKFFRNIVDTRASRIFPPGKLR